MSYRGAMSDAEVRVNLEQIRGRIIDALADDHEARQVFERVFAPWDDAQLAVVWMLGNAARFGNEAAQAWLDLLVDPDGEPRA